MTNEQETTIQAQWWAGDEFGIVIDGDPYGPGLDVSDAKAVVLWLRESWPELVALLSVS